MTRELQFLAIVTICCAMVLSAHAEEVAISEEMTAALEKYTPRFVSWKVKDYSPTVQKNAIKNKRLPNALELEVNGDGNVDLILDGHDDQKSILLCLLSKSEGYEIVIARESGPLNPNEIESWNDGEKENGLNYYLWPHKHGRGFTLAYPQQSDAEGNLLVDGVLIEYTFKDGKFQEKRQIFIGVCHEG